MNAIELNHACTYATPEELYWLTEWAKRTEGVAGNNLHPNVVMIGAGPGVMAMALFDGNMYIALSVIDLVSVEYVRAHIRAIRNDDFPPQINYMTGDSSTIGKMWGENSYRDNLDLLIIDGDHSYEGVKRDLDAWLKHVKPNGLVFLHDYDADGTCFAGVERYPGVKQAIEECSAHWEEYARVGTAMVMKVLA